MGGKLITVILSTAFLLSGCSKDDKTPPNENIRSETSRYIWSLQASEQPTVKVLNQFGDPVEKAQILIGMAQGNPFKGNFVTTDKSGVAVVPSEWTTSQHITIDASGYIRLTLLNQSPGDLTVRLNKSYLKQRPQISGQVTGLPIVNGDKMIDFALVMPAFNRGDLLNFDLDSVISPFSDTLTVAGYNAPVPSNVSLPTQKENYIFNLTVSKPVYQLTLPNLGSKRFFAARGQFPFKAVVDQLRAGKQFYELINLFSIQGGGLRDVNITQPTTNLDLPGNEMSFQKNLTLTPTPPQTGEVLISAAISEAANSLIPTDIRRVTDATPFTMGSIANKPAYIVTALKRETEFASQAPGADRVSVSFLPYKSNMKANLLPLVDDPRVNSGRTLEIAMPRKPNKDGVYPLAISAVVSDLEEVANGDARVYQTNRRWEIFGLGWNETILLPQWTLSSAGGKKRVEINFIGSTTHQSASLDEDLLQKATHVTHSSTDF